MQLKLTAELQEKVCGALRHGAPYKIASKYAGMSYETFQEYRQKGAAEPGTVFEDFLLATTKAEGEFIMSRLEKIEEAGKDPKYWAANAWNLERRYPEDFGKAPREIKHSGDMKFTLDFGGPVKNGDGDAKDDDQE